MNEVQQWLSARREDVEAGQDSETTIEDDGPDRNGIWMILEPGE
jgi:hypothetical protein